MDTKYELERLALEEGSRWDELIAPYQSRELFHHRVWLDYLAASRSVEIRLWTIRRGHRTVGYFCGGIVRKGPFRILGSPLKGWGSNFMGPVVNGDFDQGAFLQALDKLAAEEHLAMIEIESPVLTDDTLGEDGYQCVSQPNLIVELTPNDLEQMWNRVDPRARTKIRKAKRLGLTVEDTSDPGIVDEFYDQYTERLGQDNLVPPYSRMCAQLLYDFLKPRDLLFSLRVRDPAGRVIATALYPHDDRTLYGWGRASRIEAWQFSPNDFLQWAAMEMAAKRGLQIYNMCSYGTFFSKFGGSLQETKRWQKYFWPAARLARRAYELYFRQSIRMRGMWQGLARRRNEPAPGD